MSAAWAQTRATARRVLAHPGAAASTVFLCVLLAATVLGLLVKSLFGGQPIYALVLGGGSLALAAVASLALPDLADPARKPAA